MLEMLAVGVPVPGDLDGGWDLWLPLCLALAFVLVIAVNGWRLNLRRILFAVASGMAWAWSVNRLGVIPAAAGGVMVVVLASAIIRRRGRTRDVG